MFFGKKKKGLDLTSSSSQDDTEFNMNVASLSEIDERDYASQTEDEATYDGNETDSRYYMESYSNSFATEATEDRGHRSKKGPPVPRILANHQRVPGGAAAKLIGRKENVEDEDYQFVNEGDDALEVVAPVDELIKSRDMAKVEFSKGSTENKRYHAPVFEEKKEPHKESLPCILDKEKIFHEDAAAAIASILTPARKPMELSRDFSDMQLSPTSSSRRGVFEIPTKKSDVSDMGLGNDVHSAVDEAMETMTSTGRNPLVQTLITEKTERHLATIKTRMKEPTKNLTELMEAIASPPDGQFDRHYMVRRKNACGALKVLTANASHRVNICWTIGVLPALTSVLEDCGSSTLEEKFPNPTVREEYIEARKRAVSALVYLAIPKNNKLPILHCPRLVASLIRVIEQDAAEARKGCCVVLAHLSKSKENRLIMAQVPGLLDVATAVIEPRDYVSRSEDGDSMSSGSDNSETSERELLSDTTDDDNEMSLADTNPTEVLSKDTILSNDPAELSAQYDEDPDTLLHGARQNMFALLGHLVKEKDNVYILARHMCLIKALISITRLQESDSQDLAIKLLAHLSRHRSNSKILVFKVKDVVPALVYATNSDNDESRKYACYALQNFSQDKPCRSQLASIDDLLPALCRRIRGAKDAQEKLSALHTLKNLTDEPANLIPLTNTPECFATLMQVAHASDYGVTETMQYLACDALATLSHWFRSIATSGHRIGMKQKHPGSPLGKEELFVPSLRALTWSPWQ